ncbi:MAG: hypothetical protein JSV52_02910 [Candidatus Zixiibacteriota bacterium]|nr:MAG: hypothetical protein JSV52_02910 [candidate division Zixibacteria bacterium]
MRIRSIVLTAMVMLGSVLLLMPAAGAQMCESTGNNFVDLNGDGFNDNAPDHDGDGIPNGLDADYVKHAQAGTGYQMHRGHGEHASAHFEGDDMTRAESHGRFGTPNCEVFCGRRGSFGTTDGPDEIAYCGFGSDGMSGTAVCDGTGPQGARNRGCK